MVKNPLWCRNVTEHQVFNIKTHLVGFLTIIYHKTVTVRISKIEMRISEWYFDIRNCALKVSFDNENVIFEKVLNAKVCF